MVDVVKDLKAALSSKAPEIAKILATDFREQLNKNVHILDLSYNTLLSSTYSRLRSTLSKNEQALYDKAYGTLLDVLTEVCAKKTVTGILDPRFKALFERIKSIGPILFYNGDSDKVFLVGSTFASLQSYYSKNIASHPKLKSTRFGISTTYKPEVDAKGREIPNSFEKTNRIRVDFGHIPTAGDSNLTSPLVNKISAVINSSNDPLVKANAERALKDLYAVQVKIAHRFKNTTPEVIETSRSILGSGYVVVTLQNQRLNNQFSKEEARIYFNLINSIVRGTDYLNMSGSNTIKQDIAEGLANIIKGNGKLAKHPTRNAQLDVNIKAKPKVTTTKAKTVKVREKVVTGVGTLAPLQSLLDASLVDRIKQNMGRGHRHDILNLRTGRLAESASVERLSESRAGMITAFYRYMKNPYATFSGGGRQEYPKTRDPKLLIAKSIREIASKLVGNRLRSVAL